MATKTKLWIWLFANAAIVKALTLLSLSILLFFPSSSSAAPDEVRALLEFKKGIKDDPLKKVTGSWNRSSISPESDLDVCPSSFYGVQCDPTSNAVVAIVLERLALGGELKFFTLTGLKSLQKLSLSGNYFSGRLVPALGSMTTLQHLDLSDNKFYGPIPARLNDLYGLNHLNLSLNNFDGWYPSGIRNLNQLKQLDIHSNRVSGDVRNFFAELQNVAYIDLSHNLFSGGLPSSVQNISGLTNTLQYLNLSYNQLAGGFLSTEILSLLKNLETLDLGDNLIAGEVPSFVSLSNLKVLRLGNNQLLGEVPMELMTSLIPLKELDLSRNQFSGSLTGINSSTLNFVNISSNALTGPLPASMGVCIVVDLSRNRISGDISVLENWGSTLEVLDLSSNMLNGSLSELGTRFPGLVSLKISNSSLVGNLPQQWNSFSRLSTIDLSVNEFAGPLPPSLFSSENLITLNLSGNHISGVIPLSMSDSHELLALPSYPPMETLDLSDNMLAGSLPPEIGSIGRLQVLNLRNNKLSGQIPNELGKMTMITFLDLSRNHFEGQLPDDLPPTILEFNVSYNNLSGPIPPNLRKFPPSAFHPGNDELLQIPDGGQFPPHIHDKDRHHSSKSSIKIAIILASVCAAFMIAFVLVAYYRAHAYHGRKKFNGEPSERDVKVGRFNRPSLFKFHPSTEPRTTSLSFSNDHLLTENSRSLSGQAEFATEIVEHVSAEGISSGISPVKSNLPDNPSVTSARRSSSGSPVATSPRFGVSEQPVVLDVCSPDRLVGELMFLDTTLSFTAEELSRAPAEVLGRSSHGTLYKATLESGQMLTVKWLRVGLVKNKKEFAKEVKKIGSLRHPNLVPVRAYYWGPREQERLVLADYIQGDSLVLHLHESTPRRYSLFNLNQRLRLAVDVARCLLFLHNHGMPHGNLKPTNILLSGPDLSAQLTDYGLHRLMTPAGISEQILNLGALGYCAPEIASSAKPTPSFKADVYALGVILMELLTRRSAGDIISGQSGQVDLTDWVRLCDQEGRRTDCLDRDLCGGEEPSKAMDDLLVVSIKCIRPVNERPNIQQVYEELCSLAAA